ncbi:MAG TPA: polymer-forming cytoskeletal protein [Pyrinomonadaceae bacterium]|nr:polymer-forming cytoskeletal protein [Pyrinomonadaceae bacterium]
MFRPGRNKDQPGEHANEQQQQQQQHQSQQPTTSGYGTSSTSAANADTTLPGSRSTSDQPSSTGARNMSETNPTTSRAVSESESLARDIKEGTLSGFVGNGTTLTGEANFKGMLRVDGHLSGRVSSQDGTLIVSTGGQVDADVEVSVAQIYGTVIGNITATKRIELGRVAKVTGDIQTPALVIEQGAMFEGSCRMQQIKDAQAKEEARPTSSSSAAGTSSASLSSSATSSTSGAKPDGTSTTGASTTGAGASGSQSGASKTTPATT